MSLLSDLANKKSQKGRLNNLKYLLLDFLDRKDVEFQVKDHKITITYEDFTEGYEEFIPILVAYIEGEVNAIS